MDATQAEIVKELLARVGSAQKVEDQGDGFVHFQIGRHCASIKDYGPTVCLFVVPKWGRNVTEIEGAAPELRQRHAAIHQRAKPRSAIAHEMSAQLLSDLRPWWRRWFGA